MVGSALKHYLIEAPLGKGGMGAVYRARDTVLNRTVAIKVLTASDGDATKRLLHEARTASAFNHPNSVMIHAVEQDGDTAFIVMEHVDGVSLDRVIPPHGLPADDALRYASDIADAIAAAHEQGIVHRDIKPGNVLITPAGRAKVLDFGIARRALLPEDVTRALTLDQTLSVPGVMVGTPGYMAPEQIRGESGGPRADVFALGALIFHMLTGRAPFGGQSVYAVIDATLNSHPESDGLPPQTPRRLITIVARAMAKDPDARYASARELQRALIDLLAERQSPPSARRRPYRVAAIAAAVVLLAATVGGVAWMRVRESQLRWVRDTALPEMTQLFTSGDPVAGYRLAQRAMAAAPEDPQLLAAWNGKTVVTPITSEPPGAEVAIRSLSGKDEGWIPLGRTPLTVRVPLGQMRWRFTLDGYQSREIAPNPFPSNMVLVATAASPPGMVHVTAGEFELDAERTPVKLPEFWIDTNEVTNRQFKTFIDGGGYSRREYWTQPFVKDGRTVTWEEAIAMFRDRTGRPGPSSWELGSFPDGQEDWPVSGVSWYEAAAFAAFAGKSLPTVYHWFQASGATGIFAEILQFSNFGGRGPMKVGTAGSLGPFGTQDMAGNVKEWTWNESSGGQRFVLGGAWFEARHQFRDEDARLPFERDPGFGFRCIKPPAPIDNALLTPIAQLARDVNELKPVGDAVFDGYRRLYDYDQRPLDSRVEERDESNPHWTLERVSVTAAYGDERLPLLVFVPRAITPPYQAVIFFPGSDAVRARSSREAYTQWVEFLVRSGRVVAFPVYQQTYERRRQSTGPNFLREISVQRGQDVRRTVDYLATRSDIDPSKIAFYGISLGAQLAPVYLAIEPRLRTGVLLSGGFETWTIPPETDPVNFAPRVTQPVLMVNGRDDFDLPYETAQVPLFQMLGGPGLEKRHAVLEGGHIPPRPEAVFREILDWLDQHLGPLR